MNESLSSFVLVVEDDPFDDTQVNLRKAFESVSFGHSDGGGGDGGVIGSGIAGDGDGGGISSDLDPNSTNFELASNVHLNLSLYQLSNHTNRLSWIRNCSNAFENIDLEDPRVLGSLIPLGIICLVVIFGNMMVIAAVRMTHKLRGATNLFIVSLAWADLMLGMVVLPFSAMYEVFDIWIFGRIWCSIWLAIDVWVCTASILHLVVISLDRYIAVTHPITYPNIMTSNRAKLLILGAWILSFVICFPPLVGWNEESTPSIMAASDPNGNFNNNGTYEEPDDPELIAILNRCMPQCKLIQEPGYVIYSAVGSFYAPMLVMMFFNWRIYRTATKTTKAIRQGWTKVKVGGGENSVGMGIHRGGGAALGISAASTMNLAAIQALNNRTPRRSSASVKHTNAVNLSSRRASAVGANAIISACSVKQSGPPESNSRTLPRASSNCKVSVAGGSSGAALTLSKAKVSLGSNLNTASHESQNGGRITLDDTHLTTPLLYQSRKGKRISASTNSLLSVPHWDRASGLNSFHHSPLKQLQHHQQQQQQSAQPQHQKQPKQSKLKHHHPQQQQQLSAPNVSHHQPCPNHIMGKTFAEHGTQTLKEDKIPIWSNTGIVGGDPNGRGGNGGKSGKRQPFRWRSKSAPHKSNHVIVANLNSSRCSSPTNSMAGDKISSKKRRRLGSCFHFQRWRKRGLRSRFRGGVGGGPRRRSQSEPPSPVTSLPGSTDELNHSRLSAPTSNHGSTNNLTHNLIHHHHAGGSANKFGKRNIKNQVRRFRMETKAAKTLGIIVGCFICCWFPFFTMYLITAFCEDCFSELAFSIIFWMGYCNSAINPFIYAMFSREFRGAFKKILCKFLCNRNEHPGAGALVRMGLPFAPQTVAIGLADRFPPIPTVTGVPRGSFQTGNSDNQSSSNSDSVRVKNNPINHTS
ncbi:hypothetical protein TCAL_09576 [Tigriopus californicus]|uniref:G-protein coupled receptors family 1 profile domain-containing protein n=1 Tax=Tigriopus californicus TaxID=6832 RepID=A0A553PFL7_TIGCA|nr:5-hydroxytryptamine receptor 2A-like [Tigriopus californicus]TRY76464.1 hypothetical protein TCAL_09576 [Tigriopus californicus]